MQYVRFDHLNSDTRDIPDGKVFTIYRQLKGDEQQQWAFGIRINGTFSISAWKSTNVGPDEIRKSMAQVKRVRDYGWSNSGSLSKDDWGDKEKVFHCLYCKEQTMNPSKPCVCRGLILQAPALSGMGFEM